MKSIFLGLSTLLTASASAVAVARGIAFPASISFYNSTALTERDNPSPKVYQLVACTDLNFNGKCLTWSAENHLCYNFPEDWRNQITSLRAKLGEPHECAIFEDLFCDPRSKSEAFIYRDAPDLRTSNMDDVAKSYTCREKVIITPVT
ncbi:hypothetical protein IFR05_015283 [Cadophora sp. M221]|nr:hypothetical protein IFR05_015283 [Cadophora sp. M221]